MDIILDEYYRFIDTLLDLFKGDLSIEEIENMPRKKLMKLVESRSKANKQIEKALNSRDIERGMR